MEQLKEKEKGLLELLNDKKEKFNKDSEKNDNSMTTGPFSLRKLGLVFFIAYSSMFMVDSDTLPQPTTDTLPGAATPVHSPSIPQEDERDLGFGDSLNKLNKQ